MHSHVYHSIIHNSQYMGKTLMPTNEWMDKKMWYIEILFSCVEVAYPTTCDSMNGLWEPYTKQDKWDRERKVLYDIIHMWNLKSQN